MQSIEPPILSKSDSDKQSKSSLIFRARGSWLLVGLTILWGSSFVVIQDTQRLLTSGTLLFLRFLIGAVVISPFAAWKLRLWISGVELGVWLWAGFFSQAIGLRHTTAGRAAFVTSLNVVFVPLLSAATGRRVRPIVWLAAGVALGGAALLCYDRTPANVGDLWTLACAALFAVFIVRLEAAAAKFPALPLTVAQLWTVCLLSVPWFARDVSAIAHVPWVGVVYLGLVCTAVTTVLQTVGQRHVPAAQASILFMLEPVFALVFAMPLTGERLGARGLAGCATIIVATLIGQLAPASRKPMA